jgi:tetratricopeptide (TPR) repeat protein
MATAALAGTLEARVRRLHREGVAATATGQPTTGARHLRAGLALLGWRESDPEERPHGADGAALAARLLISLAYAEAEQGRTRYGFGLLDLAAAGVHRDDAGVLVQQRALMLYRVGRFAEALECFAAALPLLELPQHAAPLCSTLLNRAALYERAGDVPAARADLARCERIARRNGFGLLAAKALHSRGICDKLAGDLPLALAAFDAAGSLYREHGAGFFPVLAAAKAGALLTAGLAREAGRHLDGAIGAFGRQRLSQELAEAELLRAAAAADSGDHEGAAGWATRAERRFRRRGNATWAALAALTVLRAELAAGRPAIPLSRRAIGVARRLRQAGLARDADLAELIAIRAMTVGGRTSQAQRRPVPRARRNDSLELLLTRRLTVATLACAVGRHGPALATLRAGLSALHRRRSRLGSVELRAGMTALGSELAAAGLDCAFDTGRPATVFAWSEQSRGQAFRVPSVRPPADEVTAAALTELRRLRAVLRTAEIERRREPGLLARCDALERLVRERSWQLAGPRRSDPVVDLSDVMAELDASGRVLVSFVSRHGRLHALVVRDGTVRLVGLGDHATVEEAGRRLLADLDALAVRRLSPALAETVHGSVERQLRVLSDQLLAGVRDAVADHELVVVPTRTLSSVPWAMLPELRDRPVTVAASASAWIRSRQSDRRHALRAGSSGRPLLVAGPGLAHADAELRDIAAHTGGTTLTGTGATVAATLGGLDGAPVAHLAAHGHHEHENVLFSRLDLADGPLMAYDLDNLRVAPAHVTLSACDVGRAAVGAGDELLGFTAALLYAGTATVVSCVARVSHESAAAVMTRYHRAVAAGAAPAHALATAAHADRLAPFVCFGAG